MAARTLRKGDLEDLNAKLENNVSNECVEKGLKDLNTSAENNGSKDYVERGLEDLMLDRK